MTNFEFYHFFDKENNCLNFFKKYYQRVLHKCPKCGHEKLKWSKKIIGWRCCKCSKKISLKSISFMRDSNKLFMDWLEILHLVCHSKKSVSINEIFRKSRQTRYETVYHMVQKIRVEMGKINSIDAINSYTEFMFLEMNRKVFMNLPLSIRMTFWKSPTRTRDKVRLVVPVFLHEAILNTKVQLLEKNNYPYKKLLFVNHEIVFNKKATQLSEEIINLKWRSHLRNNVMKLLKGIYHYTTGLHLQGVLDEYSFKYNYRNTKWCKLRMFMNLEIKCIRQNNGDSG